MDRGLVCWSKSLSVGILLSEVPMGPTWLHHLSYHDNVTLRGIDVTPTDTCVTTVNYRRPIFPAAYVSDHGCPRLFPLPGPDEVAFSFVPPWPWRHVTTPSHLRADVTRHTRATSSHLPGHLRCHCF